MEKYLEYLKDRGIEFKTEGDIAVTEDKSERGKNISVLDIISDGGSNISTIVAGLTGTVPFYKKIDLLVFLNEKNKEVEDIKFTVSEDSKIMFSVNRLKAEKYEMKPEDIFENRKRITEYVENYSTIDYINEHFSKKLDLNAMISEVKTGCAEKISESFSQYLRDIDYFSTDRKSKNGVTVRFKLVNREENVQEIEAVFSNSGKHKIIYKDIFSKIPEGTPVSTFEAAARANESVREIKFIYDLEDDRVDGIVEYLSDSDSFDAEKFMNSVLKFAERIYDERTNYVKYLISSVDELLIEVPDENSQSQQ